MCKTVHFKPLKTSCAPVSTCEAQGKVALTVFAGQKHDKLLPTLLELDPGPTSWLTVPQIYMN